MKRQLHWYARDVEAYGRDTAHLSMLEHGAYTLLLDHYYRTKRPLPANREQLVRICRCNGEAEITAMSRVLDEFFVYDDLGAPEYDPRYLNLRADAEIKKSFEISDKRRDAGSKGGSNSGSKRQAIGEAIAPAIGDTPTPTPTEVQNRTAPAVPAEAPPPCPFDDLVSLYHDALPANPRVVALNDKRRGYMRARWREAWERRKREGRPHDADALLNWFSAFLGHAANSEFLTGRSKPSGDRPPFVADIEWIFRPENFLKIAEGKYHGGQA